MVVYFLCLFSYSVDYFVAVSIDGMVVVVDSLFQLWKQPPLSNQLGFLYLISKTVKWLQLHWWAGVFDLQLVGRWAAEKTSELVVESMEVQIQNDE